MENELIKSTIRVGNSAGVLLPKEYLNTQVKIVLQPLNIEKDILGQLGSQLSKQKEINNEKELGNNISSTTQKLFKIATEEGSRTAQRIGEVLRGQRDFNIFVRQGGKDLEVFKREFEDIFKAQQALQFFRGQRVSGRPELRGGANIPVAQRDEALINGLGNLTTRIALEQQRSENFVNRLNNNASKTDVNTTAINANTQSLQQLTTIFQQGGLLRGANAQQFVGNQLSRQQNINRIAQRVAPSRQILDITVNVDGQNLQFQGSPNAIRQLASQVSVEVAKAVETKIVNDIARNPQSPSAQAVDQRINEF